MVNFLIDKLKLESCFIISWLLSSFMCCVQFCKKKYYVNYFLLQTFRSNKTTVYDFREVSPRQLNIERYQV